MCFGRKHCQRKYEPIDNNYCGGFALNAVLAELGQPNDPMAVYNKIQQYQKTNVLCNPRSFGYEFLQQSYPAGNNTYMSLPSGICAAFKESLTSRTVTVYYTTEFGSSPMFGALIGEESGRITALGIHVEVFDGDLPTIDQSYVLVLVNDCHWIAVKNETTSFTCYDPDSGNATTASSMEAAIKGHPRITVVNGLYICIV